MTKTVMLQNPDGTESAYVPYAERLKQFLTDFPIKEGWQRIAEPMAPADIVTGFNEAYSKHVSDCEALGIAPKRIVAYRAKLIDPQGRVALQVHKIGIVDSWRDVMGAETRALDRILVHAGYGSDPEEDIEADLRLVEQQFSFQVEPEKPTPGTDDSLATQGSAGIEVVGKQTRGRKSKADKVTVQNPVVAEDVPEPKPAETPHPVDMEAAAQVEAPSDPEANAIQSGADQDDPEDAPQAPVSNVPAPMLNTLHTMQASRKMPVTYPSSVEDCRATIRQLMNS